MASFRHVRTRALPLRPGGSSWRLLSNGSGHHVEKGLAVRKVVGDVPWEAALGIPVRADMAWTLGSARTPGEELWTAGLSGEMRET